MPLTYCLVLTVLVKLPNEVKELLRVKPGEDSLLLSEILRYNIIIDESVSDKDEVLIGGASIILLV